MAVASQQELVERIWSRDASVWTGDDEDKWLGWLDEPKRMQERIDELERFAADAHSQFTTFVLLGMGGSSLAPEVLKRTFGVKGFHVLDTTHPAMIRHSIQLLDLEKTMFIVSSKSGTTLETLSQGDFFWEQTGGNGSQFVAITDPGSSLESQARQRDFRRPLLRALPLWARACGADGSRRRAAARPCRRDGRGVSVRRR
jgi:transaldolase/glucose-6-phosphate isomerase